MAKDALIALTDAGNAERFARQWKGRLIFVPGIGWHVFDGKRWAEDKTGKEMECAKQTVRDLLTEAANCKKDDVRTAITAWALKAQDVRRIAAIPTLAHTDARFAVSANRLDADAFALNVANGTIDLRTGKVKAHDPADLITKLAPVTYDHKMTSDLFATFLHRILGGIDALERYVRRLLGMCLTGDASEQILPIFWGEGANGKSTLLGIVQHVMGDYAGSAPDSLLTLSARQEHPTEIADLQGRRLAIASETEANARLRVQLVKKLTGEVTLKARRMYGDYYEFSRTHKLIMQTNNKPIIREQTEAVWRRIRLVPFDVIIPASERDTRLLEKLKAEATGILTWLVLGCLEWQKEGLAVPEAVEDATRHYREDSDPLKDFIDECCIIGTEAHASSADLRRAYERNCEGQGIHPISSKAFSGRLAKLGATPERQHSGRFWRGIGLMEGVSRDGS